MRNDGDNLFIVPAYHRALGRAKLQEQFPDERFIELPLEELAGQFRKYLCRFQRYRRTVFFTYDLNSAPRIAMWSALLSWIGRSCTVLDASGRKRTGSLLSLVSRDVPQLAAETVRVPFLLRRVSGDLAYIGKKQRASRPNHWSAAFLRTNHWFGVMAGGSVSHIAGVANSLHDSGIPLVVLSSDRLELVVDAIEVRPHRRLGYAVLARDLLVR